MRKFQLDQNFLKSPKLTLFLIGHSNIKKRDLVIDLGAGSGVITSALARRCKRVIAVEKDPETAKKLQANLERQKISNVEIFVGDLRELKLPSEPYKIFANPPFSLSAEVFYKLLNLENRGGQIVELENKNHRRPDAIYLILQKQLALKLIITERHYTSQLGRILAKNYATRIRLPLKETDFTPPPHVPTVLFEAKQITLNLEPGTAQHNCSPS